MTGLVAVSRNWVIGKDGKIPWRSKSDFAWFKELTLGKTILVGRKTYETLPPLKNRNILVITNNKELLKDFPYISLDEFVSFEDFKAGFKDAFVCGGGEIYKKLIPLCSELYLTEFDFNVEEEGEIVKFPYPNYDLGAFFNRREEIKKIENGRIWHYTR